MGNCGLSYILERAQSSRQCASFSMAACTTDKGMPCQGISRLPLEWLGGISRLPLEWLGQLQTMAVPV